MSERPKSVGSLANIMQSYELFRDFITSSTITVLIDVPFIFIFVLVINWIGGPIFWVPLTVIPLVLIVGLLLQIPLIRLTKNGYKLSAEKQAILFESLHNIETVKTTSAESGLQAKWEEVVYLININGSKIKNWSNFASNFSVLVQQLATVAVVIWGVYLISNNELTLGALIACSILTGRAIAPMTQIANLFTRYYQATNALQGIDKLMQLNTDTSDESAYLHRPRLQGDINFKNVNFSYADENTPILQNLNFEIKAGEKVAVIGRIGSGKSTLARLLLRLYEPTSGSILYDGTDYRQINPDDIREQIGYVCQDVSLFYGSVRENITVAAPFIDDQRLINICNTAGIGILYQ